MRASCLAGAVLLFVASRSPAQLIQGGVSVAGGSATDVRGATSRAFSVTPSIAYVANPNASFAASGGLTRFDNQQSATSLDGAALFRAPLGRFVATSLRVAGGGLTTSYDVSYATANAVPAIEVGGEQLTGFAGFRGAIAALTNPMTAPSLPGLPERTTSGTNRVSTSSSAVLAGLRARFATPTGEAMILDLREERGAVSGARVADHIASLSLLDGRTTLGATAGVRVDDGASTTYGSASLSIAMTRGASIELAGGTFASNRLLRTPGGRFLNLGVSLHGSRAATAKAAEPADVSAPPAGTTRLTLRAPDASTVDVAGDFTSWKPVAMRRAANGVWYVDLKIPAGQYRYGFRENGRTWRVPEGAATADDDFGGKSAWLTVSPSNAAR